MARWRMISLSVDANRLLSCAGSGTESQSGRSKMRPSGRMPDAKLRMARPFRRASVSREKWRNPHGSWRRLEQRNQSVSSKYRLCVWKWCGPRCIPSDQTTRDRNFIAGRPPWEKVRYQIRFRIDAKRISNDGGLSFIEGPCRLSRRYAKKASRRLFVRCARVQAHYTQNHF